jgi:hypothetical protein
MTQLRSIALAVLIAALPAAALAQSAPMATSANQAAADQIDAWLRDAPPVELEPDAAPGVISGEPGKRQIHGEVGVAIGTGGYRSAYVISAIPVGEDDTLYIALSQSQGRERGHFYADPRPLAQGLDLMSPSGCHNQAREPGPRPSPWRSRALCAR